MHDDKTDRLEAALAAHVRSRRGPAPPALFTANVLRQVRTAELERTVQTLLLRAFAPFLAVVLAAFVLMVATLHDPAWSDIMFFSKIYSTGQSSLALWFIG